MVLVNRAYELIADDALDQLSGKPRHGALVRGTSMGTWTCRNTLLLFSAWAGRGSGVRPGVEYAFPAGARVQTKPERGRKRGG